MLEGASVAPMRATVVGWKKAVRSDTSLVSFFVGSLAKVQRRIASPNLFLAELFTIRVHQVKAG